MLTEEEARTAREVLGIARTAYGAHLVRNATANEMALAAEACPIFRLWLEVCAETEGGRLAQALAVLDSRAARRALDSIA